MSTTSVAGIAIVDATAASDFSSTTVATRDLAVRVASVLGTHPALSGWSVTVCPSSWYQGPAVRTCRPTRGGTFELVGVLLASDGRHGVMLGGESVDVDWLTAADLEGAGLPAEHPWSAVLVFATRVATYEASHPVGV